MTVLEAVQARDGSAARFGHYFAAHQDPSARMVRRWRQGEVYETPLGFLMRHVRIDERTGCWEWLGFRNDGYGQVTYRGKVLRAHRLSWRVLRGPLSDDLSLDHLCLNKGCVNPDHLDPCTSGENTLRAPHTLTAINKAKRACHRGHPFSAVNTYRPPAGGRRCRSCQREAEAKYRSGRQSVAA